MLRFLFLSLVLIVGCTSADNDGVEIPVEPTPIPPTVPNFAEPSSCAMDTADCLEREFWRVFQRDFEDRLGVHRQFGERLPQLAADVSTDVVAKLTFRRAQLGMALILENGELGLLPSVIPDIERALDLVPNDPFYLIWLDTMRIATAQISGDAAEVEVRLEEAWSHLSYANEHTTRSTLVASLTGTTIGLSLSTNAPQRTIEVLDNFACHPDVLARQPEQMCGRGEHRRPCIDWCLQPSAISPFTGPGLLYHQAEAYARVGLLEEARDLLQQALQAPTADVWPFRHMAVQALQDVARFSSDINPTNPEQAVFLDVYANSQHACVFCHASPEANFDD